MLGGCLYHQLDFLIPNISVVTKKNDLRESGQLKTVDPDANDDTHCLKYLSACKIIENFGTANQLLPHLPPMLYPAIFHALALKQFYSWNIANCQPHSAQTLSLISIMENWPFPEMIVRDLLPRWVNPLNKPHTRQQTLIELQESLVQFISHFFNILLHSYLSRYVNDRKTREKHKLVKLDMSGCGGFACNINDIRKIEATVRKAYDPNSPSNYPRGELIVDIHRVELDPEMMNLLGVVCTLSRHHGAGLVVKFRKLSLWSSLSKDIVPMIQLVGKDNTTDYLELDLCEITNDASNNLGVVSETLLGLSLAYSYGFASLQFITLLSNLCQLNLSGIQVTGKLEPLCNLQTGLKYLKLVGCRLTHTDLDMLGKSHHAKSLLHLDLSENSFNLPVNTAALCNLFEKLSKLLVLELQNCKLNTIAPENLSFFMNSFKALPELMLLKLTNNDFSSRIIMNELPQIACCPALRYLCLTVPSDAYLSDDYNVNANAIKRIQSGFSQQIQTFSRYFHVEWKENIAYSHWYYSV